MDAALNVIAGTVLPPLAWQNTEPFDMARFQPIADRRYVKPAGGLWTSPLRPNGGTGWTQWCRDEEFGDCDAPLTLIVPEPTAVVYVVDDVPDLLQLEAAFPGDPNDRLLLMLWPSIDWPAVADAVDAVWLTDGGQWRTRHSRPSLYGWDCETVLWLQPRFTARAMSAAAS